MKHTCPKAGKIAYIDDARKRDTLLAGKKIKGGREGRKEKNLTIRYSNACARIYLHTTLSYYYSLSTIHFFKQAQKRYFAVIILDKIHLNIQFE